MFESILCSVLSARLNCCTLNSVYLVIRLHPGLYGVRSRVPDIDRCHVTTAGPTAMTAHASLLSSVNPFTPLNLISLTESHFPPCLCPRDYLLVLSSTIIHWAPTSTTPRLLNLNHLSSLQPSPSSFSPLRFKLCGTYLDPLSLFPLVSPSVISDTLDTLDHHHRSPL